MKKFLKHILLFSAIMFALGCGLDYFITRPFKNLESSPFANWNDIYQKELNSDVLIMGTSRAYVQFNPKIIDSILQVSSYNLGCNGRAVDAQITKYRIYRHEQKQKPKLILYELYPGSMDTSNGYERIQYIPYLRKPYLWWLTHETEKFSWADGFVPCWRYLNYKDNILPIRNGKSFYCQTDNKLYKGFIDYEKPWDGSKLAKMDTIFYHKNPEIIKQFEKFLDDCQKENIKVVFVFTPYYIEATRKIFDLEGMYEMYQNLADKHDCLILDYFNDELAYDTVHFYNATHLNREGATIFSKKLAHDIDSLQLLR